MVTHIKWETSLTNQPGKLTFSYLEDEKISINEGSSLPFKVDGKGVFFGYIFKRGKKKDEKIPVTAYDQMRYPKIKISMYYLILRLPRYLIHYATISNYPAEVKDASSYIVFNQEYSDNETLFEIIQHAIDETLTNTVIGI